jgi:hypothetical protein
MFPGFRARFVPCQEIFDQINTPTRAIQLIPKHLIGRTGSSTKATVDATAQDALGLINVYILAKLAGDLALHRYSSG